MMFLGGITEINCGEQGKYIRLKKRHQQFNQEHENHE